MDDAEAIQALVEPRSVAVIGVSQKPEKVGHKLFRNILAHGYTGELFAVDRKGGVVAGQKVHASLAEVPPVDLAVVAIPAEAVPGVLEECGQRAIRNVVVVSAGFKETPAGKPLEAQLRAAVQRYGLRLVGPNGIGIINGDPKVSLHATFASRSLKPGRIAIASQSGGVGIMLLDAMKRRGLGLARFVSLGNKTNVDESDVVQEWGNDEDVDAILLYLEGILDPERFERVAGQVARHKPVLLVKSGRSQAGAHAAASHTAAARAEDEAIDGLCRRAGILRLPYGPTPNLASLSWPAGRWRTPECKCCSRQASPPTRTRNPPWPPSPPSRAGGPDGKLR